MAAMVSAGLEPLRIRCGTNSFSGGPGAWQPARMRAVLRTPGVAPLFFASCVARLPMGALGLILVLHTQELTGSYARGGVVAGVYTLALAISNPLLARVADRRGQTVVLSAGAPIAAGAMLAV